VSLWQRQEIQEVLWFTIKTQMMLEHLGDEYRSYVSRTGRVIPPLGR